MLFLPNETLYGALIDGRRKRPSDQKQKFWPFWPNFGQIQQSAALNVRGLAKITFIKNEPYYDPTKLAEGKGQQT